MLPETNVALKIDGWNTSFLFRWPIFRFPAINFQCYVSFREGSHNCHIIHPLHVFCILRELFLRRPKSGKKNNSESNLSNKESGTLCGINTWLQRPFHHITIMGPSRLPALLRIWSPKTASKWIHHDSSAWRRGS